MLMIRHFDFITTKITILIEEAICAISGVGHGIETYPLGEYIYQSLVLKMLGFQEQKLKCVMWELASYDYEIRYEFLKQGNRTGEYSKYENITKKYKRIKEKNKCIDNKYSFDSDQIDLICENMHIDMKELFKNTNFIDFKQEDFLKFYDYTYVKITEEPFLSKILKDIYGELYDERNRIAHNTLSYQENLPKLEKLSEINSLKNNYFMWLYVLVVVDEIFIQLYKDYVERIKLEFN